MTNSSNFIEVSGDEKNAYMANLDKALKVLVNGIKSVQNDYVVEAIRRFGDEHKWNWQRFPNETTTYALLSEMVEAARQNYEWFSFLIDSQNPEHNRAYFDTVELSTESGLPWVYSFIQLHKLRNDGGLMLKDMPDYGALAARMKALLMEDHVLLENVEAEANILHRQALRRSYLEQLMDAKLLNWEASGSSKPTATKVMDLGVEALWNLTYARFSPATAAFHFYVIDMWQDILEPQIVNGVLSSRLESSLQFGEGTSAYYMLGELDRQFRSIHPVHVSRGILGPYESKYTTKQGEIKFLPVTRELLAENPEAMILRFRRQYALAPNHEETKEGLRQILHRQEWSDEFIVCPAQYSKTVADSLLGTSVRILEM